MLPQPYISGFERKRHEVFGVELHPLTLGHVQILAEMDCMIAFPGKTISVKDVGIMVFVCSYPQWEQAREQIANTEVLGKLLARISDLSADELRAGAAAAGAYFEYYKAMPDTDEPSVPWEGQRVPWWWGYAEFMQSVLGRDEVTAWGTICSDAAVYWACFATRQGSESVTMLGEAHSNQLVRTGMSIKEQFDKGLL